MFRTIFKAICALMAFGAYTVAQVQYFYGAIDHTEFFKIILGILVAITVIIFSDLVLRLRRKMSRGKADQDGGQTRPI